MGGSIRSQGDIAEGDGRWGDIHILIGSAPVKGVFRHSDQAARVLPGQRKLPIAKTIITTTVLCLAHMFIVFSLDMLLELNTPIQDQMGCHQKVPSVMVEPSFLIMSPGVMASVTSGRIVLMLRTGTGM